MTGRVDRKKEMLPLYPRITDVVVPRPFVLSLRFTDGTQGEVDLGPMIRGRSGVFTALKDPEFFAQVQVDPEAGTVVWPNGVDLDPDVLYHKAHRKARTG
ncbi:MAG: DUF2442 domain-containing protein [Gemmatimonadales bacterium]